jgi:hypothetical protein
VLVFRDPDNIHLELISMGSNDGEWIKRAAGL